MTIATWIKDIREGAGLTQLQAAEKLGVHRTTWVRWESGTHKPEPGYLVQLADWGGTSFSDLGAMLNASA